ncbi:MAG: hydantoinase/oxoprolinase family protein, partial [Acidobacteriales bacterium]|nr:hydantoinase/oxoprolinase family protein [Terriglobales bacterium]
GAMNFATGAENPVHAVFSGPSGGAVGSRALADVIGRKNLIAIDMGGTSFDVSLVYGGKLQHLSSGVFAKFPVLTQVIDIRSIGAGGGSIAWIDAGGRLDVGPQSAGAVPGPICYGRGGEQPTVTDAALAAGWLSPTYFLGGERTLDLDAATAGIKQKIANPLGLDLATATAGILNIVTSKMAGAIREITVESGYDPRDFALVAFGGAGPLFATALAEELAIPSVIIPVGPGTFSAWGMLTVDLTYDLSQTYLRPLDGSELDGVTSSYERLVSKGMATLDRQGVPAEKRRVECSIEMRYQGQEHSIAVPLPDYRLTAAEVERLATRFGDSHEALYGHRLPHPAEITTLRVKAIGMIQKPQLKKVARGSGLAPEAVKGNRSALDILRRRNLASRVYERSVLKAGDTILGPAVIEEPTSCTVIYAGQKCRMDDFGNLVIAMEEHSASKS